MIICHNRATLRLTSRNARDSGSSNYLSVCPQFIHTHRAGVSFRDHGIASTSVVDLMSAPAISKWLLSSESSLRKGLLSFLIYSF